MNEQILYQQYQEQLRIEAQNAMLNRAVMYLQGFAAILTIYFLLKKMN